MGHEHHQFCGDHHGQQASNVPQGLRFPIRYLLCPSHPFPCCFHLIQKSQVLWPCLCPRSAATTLTAFHFTVTALVGYVSSSITGEVSKQTVPFNDLLWFSVVANTSIVCMNLSLMLNSVGFYQVISPFLCTLWIDLMAPRYQLDILSMLPFTIMAMRLTCIFLDSILWI